MIKKILIWTCEQLKLPLILFGLFWFAGYGFYHGVVGAEKVNQLLAGKAIIITSVDLRKDDE